MPNPAKAANDIFQAGMDARGQGEPVTACPYPDESGKREQWLEGWHDPDQGERESRLARHLNQFQLRSIYNQS